MIAPGSVLALRTYSGVITVCHFAEGAPLQIDIIVVTIKLCKHQGLFEVIAEHI